MIYLLVAVAAIARFLPHPPNVACIGAIGLLAGCYLPNRWAYALPVVAMLASDAIGSALHIPGVGFYSPIAMLAVYGGMAASVPLGRWISRSGTSRWITVPCGSIAASTIFFLISNAGVLASGWYSISISGAIACYVAAIPFYGLTMAGDLAFSTLMFGVMARAAVPMRSVKLSAQAIFAA